MERKPNYEVDWPLEAYFNLTKVRGGLVGFGNKRLLKNIIVFELVLRNICIFKLKRSRTFR